MSSFWTRQELVNLIGEYKKALLACATGASYVIGNHSLTRQDLDKIRATLKWLTGELETLETGVRGPVIVQSVIPRGRRR